MGFKRPTVFPFQARKGEWRIISVQRTLALPDMFRPFVKLSAEKLEPLVGVYDSGTPSELFTVTREGDTLYGKSPTGDKRAFFHNQQSGRFFGSMLNTLPLRVISIGFPTRQDAENA